MINPTRGMILLNKSAGLTSFQSLGVCKRSFGTKKVGHAGTLDKFAEGLLLVFINEATRLVPFFVGLDKTYEADILFGQETDTLDPAGVVVREAPIPSLAQIKAVLGEFKGSIQQIPPAYSAIHIDGKRAYERVLAGEILDLKSRQVEIYELEVLAWQAPLLSIRVSCSSGTYIRSLARDIACAAGSAGSLLKLKRTRVGSFCLDDAVVPPREAHDSQWCDDALYTDARLARSLKQTSILTLHDQYRSSFQSGKPLSFSWFQEDLLTYNGSDTKLQYCVICGSDFLGVINFFDQELSYRMVFPPLAEHHTS